MQRILAHAGVASRRAAEQFILDGRVAINGETVTTLGTKANPATDEIRVDGKVLRVESPRHLMLNKPKGYITTTSDERGRLTVMDLVTASERIYPVGRLDRDTEGLLILTNDGELANRIMHPRFGLEKEYEVLTSIYPSPDQLRRLRSGPTVDKHRVVPSDARVQRETSNGVILRVVIREGTNHVVRKMMSALDIPVTSLRRTRIGPLSLAGIPSGQYRDIRPGELGSLVEALGFDEDDGQGETRPHAAAQSGSHQLKPSKSSNSTRQDIDS
ncbi:pseudouridine synthase [soil metagenome]